MKARLANLTKKMNKIGETAKIFKPELNRETMNKDGMAAKTKKLELENETNKTNANQEGKEQNKENPDNSGSEKKKINVNKKMKVYSLSNKEEETSYVSIEDLGKLSKKYGIRETEVPANEIGRKQLVEQTTNDDDKDRTKEEESSINDTQEGRWQVVEKRGEKARQRMIRGERKGTSLQGVTKKAWLYIGKLKPDTREDDVKKYLGENGITKDISCQ